MRDTQNRLTYQLLGWGAPRGGPLELIYSNQWNNKSRLEILTRHWAIGPSNAIASNEKGGIRSTADALQETPPTTSTLRKALVKTRSLYDSGGVPKTLRKTPPTATSQVKAPVEKDPVVKALVEKEGQGNNGGINGNAKATRL